MLRKLVAPHPVQGALQLPGAPGFGLEINRILLKYGRMGL
jgi:hypothetical protein